jgi:glycosyltransferase involved in cell wall biosynthesis/ribosomal protein S18 acetylase RimI-like enzyme
VDDFEGSMPSVSVVVPVFNGAATVGEVVEQSREALAGCAGEVEFVLVNDGSGDRSWKRIEELATAAADVCGIDLSRNYGQHNALLAGIRAARCELVLTIDDDLQNPPAEIPKLLAALGPAVDVVYGEPVVKRQGGGRRIATWLVVRALRLLGGRTAPMVSSFRLFRTDLRDGFADYTGPDVSIDGLLTWQTERFASVPVRHDERLHGESNYSLLKLARHALTMITAFSTRPLRLATTVGFMVIVFGLAVLVYVLVRFLTEGHSVPGFPFLASIISIFAGAQLFSIGVIGEYLARMHVRVMAQPSYAIRARVGGGRREPAAPAVADDRDGDDEICRALAWDSEFWGLPVARVVPERLDPAAAERVRRWCDRRGVACAYLLAEAGDAETAAAAREIGFAPVDTRITLERAPAPVAEAPRPAGLVLREPKDSDRAGLADIARRAHTDTRFYFDPNFSSRRAGEMYVRWVLGGLEDGPARLIVAELEGSAAGYLLLDGEPAEIDLIAVDAGVRGRGIGGALVAAALDSAASGPVRVVTQARNVAAMRLYEGCGFRVEKTQTWYHRWA